MEGGRSLAGMLATSPLLATLGESLENVRRELILRGHELVQRAEPAYVSAIEESIRFLQQQTCRVAVIGQIKAGKSSFINSLIGRPQLLPSDVNPWTAVVTNLHFCHSDVPSERVSFSFFDRDEWRHIAESGGPLRELTERLVPDFDPQLLRAQLQSMRLRASVRLGADFDVLLGQRHDYAEINSELLAHYVSAGRAEGKRGGSEAWYSDITKSADLHFKSDRTGFPLTLVDTPGTNDPLLVRDEITRQSLASAEIYVVVLTAQQPLAIGDMALLRLLRGLHKERIVIFVNRIDGLRDLTADTARIVEHVRSRLHQEFPSVQFPIIVGSALWANSILSQESNQIARILDAPFLSYAAGLGYTQLEPLEPGRHPPADTVKAILSLSGIPAVVNEIGDLMRTGHAAHAIRQLASYFLQIAQSSEVALRAQTRAVERALGDAQAGLRGRAMHFDSWSQELREIDLASRELQANLALYEESLRNLVERCAGDMQLLLGNCVSAFIDQQVAGLTRAYRDRRATVWTCDTQPLRDALHNEFLRVYRFWEGRLAQAGDFMRSQLHAALPHQPLQYEASDSIGITDVPGMEPSVSALGRVVALDLATPWWKAWWHGRPSVESRAGHLRDLIRSEFQPLIDDLIASARVTFAERSQYASRQARIGTLDIVNQIHQRSAELIAGLEQAGALPDSGMIARLEQQLHTVVAQKKYASDLKVHLSTLVKACDPQSAAPRSSSG